MPPTPAAALLPGLPPRARIAVVRLRSLGDTVLMTPALAALKQWRPDLALAAVVEPRYAPALDGNPDLENIILAPPGFAARARTLLQLRAWRPRLAVGLHGGSTAAWLCRLSGAPRRAGFLGLRHGWAYTDFAPPPPPPPDRPRWHTAEHIAALFTALGMPPAPLGPARVYPRAAAAAAVHQRLLNAGIAGRFAFFSVNPRSFTMRWPAAEFRRLALWIWRRYQIAAVLACPGAATAHELEVVAGAPPGAAAVLEHTATAELIALEAQAEFLVGCDGGPVHLAAALGKPVVAIFSATDAVVWAPWRTAARLVQNPFACNPCPADRCYRYETPRCIESVRLEQVQAAVAGLQGE